MREGRGIYDFRDIDVTLFQRDKLAKFVGLLSATDLLPPPAGVAKPKRRAKSTPAPRAKAKSRKRLTGARKPSRRRRPAR